MKYELTERQKFRKRQLDKYVYLAKLYPEFYKVRYTNSDGDLIISLHERFIKGHDWDLLDYIVLEFENNFSWPWKQNLPNGNKNDSD